jgi:CheY-like chemotaxis protein
VTPAPIRVAIVDDDPLERRRLRELFDGDQAFVVISDCGCGDDASAALVAQRPDVVLIDISATASRGFDEVRRLSALEPQSRIVVLSASAAYSRVVEALDSGAVGYILEDDASDEIVRGVRAAAHAAATHVEVRLKRSDGVVSLEIVDDGWGFSDSDLEERRRAAHIGLRLLRDVVHEEGGRLIVDSRPGEGTCVAMDIPNP